MNTPFEVNLMLLPWKYTENETIISLIEKILSDNNITKYKIFPKDGPRTFQFETVEDANKAKVLLNDFHARFNTFINNSNLR